MPWMKLPLVEIGAPATLTGRDGRYRASPWFEPKRRVDSIAARRMQTLITQVLLVALSNSGGAGCPIY
jgi:hypothetical protein